MLTGAPNKLRSDADPLFTLADFTSLRVNTGFTSSSSVRPAKGEPPAVHRVLFTQEQRPPVRVRCISYRETDRRCL